MYLRKLNLHVQTQKGIAPRIFKKLVGANHPEFSTMRQQVYPFPQRRFIILTRSQDALEFYQYLLTIVERNEHRSGGATDPTKAFTFLVEEKLVCPESKNVKYTYRTDNSLALNVPLDRATNLVCHLTTNLQNANYLLE